jgi:hypothetical protein
MNSIAFVKTPVEADGSDWLPLGSFSTSKDSLEIDGMGEKVLMITGDDRHGFAIDPVASGRIRDLIESLPKSKEFLSFNTELDDVGVFPARVDETPLQETT